MLHFDPHRLAKGKRVKVVHADGCEFAGRRGVVIREGDPCLVLLDGGDAIEACEARHLRREGDEGECESA